MFEVEVIGVPFDGFGRPGNQTGAANASRQSGLLSAGGRHRVVDGGDASLPAPRAERGPTTHLLNEPALVALSDQLFARIVDCIAGDRFPLVVGGDCATLLGTVAGIRTAAPGAGLLFVDGHEDTMPLDVSEDGEAANCEIGLLLGLTGRTLSGPLATRVGVIGRDDLAMLGPRDESWRRQFNVGSLRDSQVWLRGWREVVHDPAGAGRDAVSHIGDPWWMHVDLDVLDPEEFGAQGLPDVDDEPGGLTWGQLSTVLTTAVRVGGCAGWSIAIYDPDQDPDGSDGRRIVGLVHEVLSGLP